MKLSDAPFHVEQRIMLLEAARFLIEDNLDDAIRIIQLAKARQDWAARRTAGRPKGSRNKKRVWVGGVLRLESEVQRELNLNIQATAADVERVTALAEYTADDAVRYASALQGETL